MNEKILTWQDVEKHVSQIAHEVQMQAWRPDYIVGIARGGLVPAVLLSHLLGVPMHSLTVSLRDGDGGESNLWMAEDAFGYVNLEPSGHRTGAASDPARRKNILILDDINDSGRTFDWIKQDWCGGCFPHDTAWQTVWNHNVRFAVLINNDASWYTTVDYATVHINKEQDPVWIVFPWEKSPS